MITLFGYNTVEYHWFPPSGLASPAPFIYPCRMSQSDTPAAPVEREVTYPYQEGKAIKKVRYSHDAMIDLIIMNPRILQNELAEVFGYTPAWVSLVMSSDAFKERLEQRKEDLVDPTIRATLNERFNALVTRSLDVLQEKLARPSSMIPDNLVLKAAELGAKSLGVGGHAPAPQPAQSNLEQLAGRLLKLQDNVRGRGVITCEAEIIETAEVSENGQSSGSESDGS